jgi:pyruvate formate lyase activating enzyme
VNDLHKSVNINLLPYHRLGEGKRNSLGLESQGFLAIPPNNEDMAKLQKIFEDYGLVATYWGITFVD